MTWKDIQKKARSSFDDRALRRTAATYSPNWCVSTIGVIAFNFSVRNGKRWVHNAIATAVCFLRDTLMQSPVFVSILAYTLK